MKYFICIFTDGKNKILRTNSLKEAMDWYANNRIDDDTNIYIYKAENSSRQYVRTLSHFMESFTEVAKPWYELCDYPIAVWDDVVKEVFIASDGDFMDRKHYRPATKEECEAILYKEK